MNKKSMLKFYASFIAVMAILIAGTSFALDYSVSLSNKEKDINYDSEYCR